MAKTVDITEKLNMDGNPVIVIKNKKLEVNADAATVLKLMDVIGDGAGTPKQVRTHWRMDLERQPTKCRKLKR